MLLEDIYVHLLVWYWCFPLPVNISIRYWIYYIDSPTQGLLSSLVTNISFQVVFLLLSPFSLLLYFAKYIYWNCYKYDLWHNPTQDFLFLAGSGYLIGLSPLNFLEIGFRGWQLNYILISLDVTQTNTWTRFGVVVVVKDTWDWNIVIRIQKHYYFI